MAKVVAITGGTGFIGRHLVARHVACGDTVRYLTRCKVSKTIAGAIAYVGDLCAPETLRDFVRDADVLYHCAAELYDMARMRETNVNGTVNLIDAAAGEVGRWVQLSSTGVYGVVQTGDVRESSPVRPGNPYECSKADADALLQEAARTRGLSCVLLRPSNVYGVDMPNQSLFQLIRMIDKGLFFFIGPRGAVANYIHVENVVDALKLCAEAELRANASAYIVSDHCPLEVFVGSIAAQLGRRAPVLRLPLPLARAAASMFGKVPGFPLKPSRVAALSSRACYQSERIELDLGYCHRVSVESGLEELVGAWRHAPC